MPYCTRQDLVDRLSGSGLLVTADDDQDGAASGAEGAALDRAIESASAEINASLAPRGLIPWATGNAWLRDRAVDLAAERLAERRGGVAPASFTAAAGRSREWLDQVRRGELRVPDLVAPAQNADLSAPGSPRVGNPIAPDDERRAASWH